ncbi:MAG: MFS transporter [Myxococcota bacterium]
MNHSARLSRIFALTFVESFAGVLLQRGVYFYTHDALAFEDNQNLWLALASGVTYIIGAVASHRTAEKLGEKRLLFVTLLGALSLHLLLAQNQAVSLLLVAVPLLSLLQGFKWPVIESFLSAGLTPQELVRTLGRFNVTWAASVPLALVAAGQIIAGAFPGALFAAAAGFNALAVAMALPLPARPAHLDAEHPERPAEAELTRLGTLLRSARWCMLSSYALLFLLAPLMPAVFAALGLGVGSATTAAGLLDLARLACFAWLGARVGWRGRTLPHVLASVCLPLGFALILLGKSLLWVLLGEALFGVAAGFVYTAALYYALLLKNASVDAGGAHEGLIGLGFALGPLAGLLGSLATPLFGNHSLAVLACSAPIALGGAYLSLRPLLRATARVQALQPTSSK